MKLQDSVQGNGLRVEPVRHEWLSYVLLKAARLKGFEAAWTGAATHAQLHDCDSLKLGIVDRDRALEYMIVSHHKLIGGKDGGFSAEGAIRGAIPLGGIQSAGTIDQSLYSEATRLVSKTTERTGTESWALVSMIGRAALIMADHYISSIDYQERHGHPAANSLFANTKLTPSGRRRYDQPLDWHLRNVGDLASDIAHRMVMQGYPGLSPVTVDEIMEPASVDRFKWQDHAVGFLQQIRAKKSSPILILCSAGTGAGKTRGNAKMACALSENPRFCIALNLRSLTLQTGDSLRNDLQIMPSEMAVVIGDRVTERMHQASSDAFSTSGESDKAHDFEVICEGGELPTWLKPLARSHKAPQLLIPPVLVSTIDFIINASEPGRQGHHSLAMLRMMNSDLILDELDSYDPPALVAVLRLIQLSGMLGKNVICSSATLSVPVATAVEQAFRSGVSMRMAVEPDLGTPTVVMVDDLLPPVQFSGDSYDFGAFVKARHAEMIDVVQRKPIYRKARIAPVPVKSEQAYLQVILESVERLHQLNQWALAPGRQLSFGLIRVANISTAIKVARFLSEHLVSSGARIACYHSNELRIQRHLKEQRLDHLLNRKGGRTEHIEHDPDVIAAFPTGAGSVPFIVVATPVEEVGRDHDFDWAVIEPSSAQSIVQTSGRVNRHRLVEVTQENVVILDCNIRSLFSGQRKGMGRPPCFMKPGFEVRSTRYSSSLISEMLHIEGVATPLERIDAAFRLGGRQMARDEDNIIQKRLEEGMDILLRRKGCEASWMTAGFYRKFPLRGSTLQEHYRLVADDALGGFELQKMVNSTDKTSWERRAYTTTAPAPNAWLVWPDAYLVEKSIELGIQPEEAMVFELANYQADPVERVIHRDESFGFYHKA